MSPIVHLLMPIAQASYCFLFEKNRFDLVYLFIVYVVVLHWCFLNGECIISYRYKKQLEPAYIAGQDSNKNDFHIEYKQYAYLLYGFTLFLNLIVMYNVYIIFKRNHYPLPLAFTFIILHEIYYYGCCYHFKNHHENKTYLLFQEVVKYLLFLWGGLFIYFVTDRIHR
jgi:hypothetical protein